MRSSRSWVAAQPPQQQPRQTRRQPQHLQQTVRLKMGRMHMWMSYSDAAQVHSITKAYAIP